VVIVVLDHVLVKLLYLHHVYRKSIVKVIKKNLFNENLNIIIFLLYNNFIKESKNYLQLRGNGVISALSVNLARRRSRSKSSEKSSSPTSPISPKFSFKYNSRKI
jgi:hypothetical protein